MSKKTFLYKDQNSIDNGFSTINQTLTLLTPLYNRYKELALTELESVNLPELTSENFEEFITNPKKFLLDILTNGETLKIGNLTIDPIKAFELFPLPDEVNELIRQIETITQDTHYNNNYRWATKQITIYENELVIDPVYVTKITDQYTYKTETEDQDTALTLITKIAENLTALKALQKKQFHNPHEWIKDLVKADAENKQFSTNVKVIRHF